MAVSWRKVGVCYISLQASEECDAGLRGAGSARRPVRATGFRGREPYVFL